ncbi:MAG: glycosyltransferase [Chloroflexi bacterium]|nr:glycosyltransferase [Chloroflexota bacterium]
MNDYSHIERLADEFSGPFSRPVTIVVLYHDGGKLVGSLLHSLDQQTYPKSLMEIIVVDDGSTPPFLTGQLPERVAGVLQIVRLEHRGYRLSTMRNEGISRAGGEIVLCVDQDIICPPWWIASHLRWFHVSNSVATFGLRKFVDTAAFPDAGPIDYSSCSEGPEIASSSNDFCLGDKRWREVAFIKAHPFPANCYHGCNIAFDRSQAIGVGMFDEAFNGFFGYEDIEFGHRLWQSGVFMVYEPAATVIHQENISFTTEYRRSNKPINRRRLYDRVPGLEQFRNSLSK